MDSLPLLSVVVPVYNVESYLDRCIRSIAEQTYTNLEIWLVDDGSTDGSGAICDTWAEKDRRIKVIHKENGGAGQARTVALDCIQGELVGLVDSDDFLERHMYEHLYSLMREDVDIAECVIGMTESDDFPMDDGRSAQVQVFPVVDAMRLHIRDELFCQTPPNKLYRRHVIADIRFPVGNLIDDEFWTYRVIGNARRLAHSSACMYAYRQQPGSAMHKPYSLKRLQGLTAKEQRLYLDGADAALMKGKRILLVDDVISTGESLAALEALATKAGGEICGRMAILAEGDAQERPDIIYLEKLPLFHPDGTIMG